MGVRQDTGDTQGKECRLRDVFFFLIVNLYAALRCPIKALPAQSTNSDFIPAQCDIFLGH